MKEPLSAAVPECVPSGAVEIAVPPKLNPDVDDGLAALPSRSKALSATVYGVPAVGVLPGATRVIDAKAPGTMVMVPVALLTAGRVCTAAMTVPVLPALRSVRLTVALPSPPVMAVPGTEPLVSPVLVMSRLTPLMGLAYASRTPKVMWMPAAPASAVGLLAPGAVTLLDAAAPTVYAAVVVVAPALRSVMVSCTLPAR